MDSAQKQITTTGLQSSPTVKQSPRDYIYREVTVHELGYAYAIVGNELPADVEIYFACPATGRDDVTTTHAPSSPGLAPWAPVQ